MMSWKAGMVLAGLKKPADFNLRQQVGLARNLRFSVLKAEEQFMPRLEAAMARFKSEAQRIDGYA